MEGSGLVLIIGVAVIIVVVVSFVLLRGRGKRAAPEEVVGMKQELRELSPEGLQEQSGVPSGATMVLGTVPRTSAWLVVRAGPAQGRIFELQRGQVAIGHEPGSGVHLDHPSVSPTHALIKVQQTRYQLYDLGSEAGTSVNGTPITGAFVRDGSRIAMGGSEIFFSRLGRAGSEEGGAGETQGVLLVRSGPSKGLSFPVGNQDLVLGRRPGEGGGQIDDPAVSLRHALVRLTEHGCVIYDLGSANGTSVDDVSLTGVLLQNGDIVRVGEVELQFVLEERD